MKIDRSKFILSLAAACMNARDLRVVVSPTTVAKILNDPNHDANPKTVGKIAKALNVPVEHILAEQEKDRA